MTTSQPTSGAGKDDAPVTELARVLGPFDVTMLVMGSVIGAGIFNRPAAIASAMGTTPGVLILWALGGVFAFTGALVFAELGGMLPHAGGEYVFVREAFGRFAAFVFGWVLLTAITSSAMAFVAGVFADHVDALARGAGWSSGFGDKGKRAIAAGLIVFFVVLNARGAKLGAIVQNASMVAKILGIVVVVALGALVALGVAHVRSDATVVHAELVPWTWGSAGAALISVIFAYGGWQNVAAAAGEIKKPERTIPLGILLGTFGVIALYLAFNWALIAILGVEGVAGTSTPVADAAEAVFRGGRVLVVALVAVSAFAFVQGLSMLAPRIYFAMARDGVFFRAAGYVHPRWRTPIVAIVVQGAIGCLYVIYGGTLGKLVDICTLCDLVFFASCGVGLFVLRVRRPNAVRPYRALWYPWLPAVFVVVTAGTVVQGAFNATRAAVLQGLALFAIGALLYVFWSRSPSAEAER